MRFFVALLFVAANYGWAAPGAHGPGGEHLDTHPHGPAQGSAPRLETQSELFELVARLQGGELSILIDRYETNEPVLRASVEVALGDRKAKATFHADHGDYAVDDKAVLEALSAPGEHGLVFTVNDGKDVDLLDGKLVVEANGHGEADYDHGAEGLAAGAGAAGIGLAAAWLLWRRRRARLASLALGVAALLAVAAVSAAPGAHGPGGEHLDAAPAANSSSLARLPDGSVNIPKLAQRRMEIRTVLVAETEVAGTVDLPGRVMMDPNAGGRVQPVHGGRIEPAPKGLPLPGQAVRRGEVLAHVRHHAEPYAEANQKAQLAQLRAEREVLEQRVKRLESLEGSVPRKEIDAARVELQGLAERERRVGASLNSREALRAPVSGVIAVARVVAGQVVEPRDVLFEVVDPARLVIEVLLADPVLAQRIAGAQLQGVDGVKLQLLGVARTLRDGMLPMTLRAEAQKGGPPPLAIGQPVQVIATLNDRLKGIVLPAQAIARNPANEPVVWIKAGAERFLPQPIRFRPVDSQTVVVTHGLGVDNRVVVRGAALIAQIR